MKNIMDTLLEYAQTNFNTNDGHIHVIHPHDLWDDYASGEIDTAFVKYESFIDILWIVAMEEIAAVYAALGDTVRSDFCTTTAATLRATLEDFRLSDGSLCYAIKPDGSLYSNIIAMCGNHYAAWLLEDEGCIKWIMQYSGACRGRNGFSSNPGVFSNTKIDQMKENNWMAFLPINALIAAKEGDYTWANELSNQFIIGGIPEYSKGQDTNKLIYASHAQTFTWAHAMNLVMVSELAKL
jgi:hypothetical protein